MAIVINGNGIDMGNTPVSNVDVGVLNNNAVTKKYVDDNGDTSAITSYSQINGTNAIEGVELTNNIHDIFGDGSAVATYQLNGNANDLGGTYNGIATNVTYEEGKFGQAAVFNGSNSKINLTGVPISSGFTLSLWAKINNTDNRRLFDTNPDGGNGLESTVTSSGVYFRYGGATPIGSAAINIGAYNHLVFEYYPGTNNSKLYANGALAAEGTITGTVTNTLQLGTRGVLNSLWLNGSIDQVRIFNRALTEAEINTLYSETRVSANATLNINQGIFIYPKGLTSRGYAKSSDTFTGSVPTSGVSDGWKYVAKDEDNNFSFYNTKPTLSKTSAELYLKDGKLYKSSDNTAITPISFLSHKVRFASGVAVELAPSDISKMVTESLEAGSYSGKNAIVAYATIDMTATPPTILDSYNVASVVRSSNGVGKITLVNSVDKNNITAICGTNAVAGTITSTTKSEINFATGTTNYAKTTIIVTGGKS